MQPAQADGLPRALLPTLILLDIEMPQIDGFDVVEALSRMAWPASAPPPLVIFVTAHPEFAVDAFDSGALLNPGKVFPTLSACVEGGYMHVHGRIPFSNLPRM